MTAVSPTAIDAALRDPALLGAALGDPGTWSTWFAVLRAAFGLQLSDEERELFAHVAGNRKLPSKRVRELWCIVGRKGGKTRVAAALSCYIAIFIKHKLARGEKGLVLLLAASMEQARVAFEAALAFLTESPVLRQEVLETTRSEIRLKNGIVISIHSNSFRSVRGRTLVACIFDEVAFWRDAESAAPDTETYSAILPSLITTNGMLVGISSAYRRTGLIFSKHRQYFGTDSDDTLVVQGSSKQFNATLDDDAIAAQRAADPSAAPSEWDSEWRDDLQGFLDEHTIARAVNHSRPLELPPMHGVFYRAFCDPSGGRGDSYAVAVAHREDERFIIDVVRTRQPPFDPETVTQEFCQLCKDYRCLTCIGDKYGAEWVAGSWSKAGGTYVPSDLSASALYLEGLPTFTRGLVELPDHPVLLRELRLLERRPGGLGKEQVSHPRNCHDDASNVVFGVIRTLSAYSYDYSYAAWNDPDSDSKEARDQEYRDGLMAHIVSCYGGRRR